ncbi:uncharacterized protein AKAW2_61384S [Aspergillus luchuensis]|uniref:Uncharacterized protein n=1 Tax=Aspergillus kawachii TaxID=1069201 RepID=A0A146EX02_ASPKA|nr:uncharacterized protein AKAW2_61384S [Aspergillus luchuensis]BCS03120.1 hypothetical protein AKAW2_61384S [Aspergillus luchuensis]BCS14765.1 hypothetical protein ALUC_61321S [Aspergillus luchuensis]GAA87886.1 hypothetical protein AKAW_06000 [Aspergillus luchuensis IFO 4308]GAT18510.1 hypothetical protein RIB2604_00100030 [Aspergillus luchuensis]
MKFTATIGALMFSLLASVSAAVTGNCTPGMNYCQVVLDNVGGNQDAMHDAIIRWGSPESARYPGLWGKYLFHCNADKSLSVVEECHVICINSGAGKSDVCDNPV